MRGDLAARPDDEGYRRTAIDDAVAGFLFNARWPRDKVVVVALVISWVAPDS